MAQNRAMTTARRRLLTLVAAAFVTIAASQSPVIEAGAVFRVFLKNGEPLPSYGESALAGDRLVFTLIVGTTEPGRTLQLVSLPADAIDVDRTRRYADSIRLTHYAATRGEVDYAAMTQEVQRALAELTAISDPKKRLAMAEDARKRLTEWAASTYGYRAADVQELQKLFDEVLNELRAAAGERQFSLELRTGTVPPPEPLLPLPTLAESIKLALAAAQAADTEEDRATILRAAAALAAANPDATDLRVEVMRAVDLERKATSSYTALAADIRAKAAEARKKGDLDALTTALATLRARDQELGGLRPQIVGEVAGELDEMVTTVRAYHAALDRYTAVRRHLLNYEREVRPTLSALDGLMPILNAIRDVKFTAYERVERAGVRLKNFAAALEQITPPAELADVHATFLSAIRMADHACARRRLAAAIQSKVVDDEASSAAAGAILLAGQAREQLVVRLYPPKLQ